MCVCIFGIYTNVAYNPHIYTHTHTRTRTHTLYHTNFRWKWEGIAFTDHPELGHTENGPMKFPDSGLEKFWTLSIGHVHLPKEKRDKHTSNMNDALLNLFELFLSHHLSALCKVKEWQRPSWSYIITYWTSVQTFCWEVDSTRSPKLYWHEFAAFYVDCSGSVRNYLALIKRSNWNMVILNTDYNYFCNYRIHSSEAFYWATYWRS